MAEDAYAHRRDVAGQLREAGHPPYPHRWHNWEGRVSAREAAAHGEGLAAEQRTETRVRVAGRVVQTRIMGKASFAHIVDDGCKLQLYLKRDILGEDPYQLFKKKIHVGDFIGIEGTIFKTRTGETSVEVASITVLAKALRGLPEKWHGLQDTDTRYRKRHLDLIANPEVRRGFEIRSRLIGSIRRTFSNLGFLEVETPILIHQAGGATARPFVTHHNVLDADLFLRIATELPLKKLLVGGFPAVYEIGRIFRNEGIDTSHNPEFTTLEAYQAYTDYHGMAALFERMMDDACAALGIETVDYKGRKINLKPPYRRLYLPEIWREKVGADIHEILEGKGFHSGRLRELAAAKAIEAKADTPDAKIFDRLLEKFIEPELQEPTFLFDHPTAITPLAKCKERTGGGVDESLVERFELFISGMEVANAYTELNDPEDQRARFAEQAKQKAGGHDEAELLDEDFVEAMEHGMPPMGGIGFGIDRLTMLLAGTPSIREVILFPTLKKE
ncbi:MAG: lysine--tRNA ligase [Elusimicrobiota bacterium]